MVLKINSNPRNSALVNVIVLFITFILIVIVAVMTHELFRSLKRENQLYSN